MHAEWVDMAKSSRGINFTSFFLQAFLVKVRTDVACTTFWTFLLLSVALACYTLSSYTLRIVNQDEANRDEVNRDKVNRDELG